ncbi:MAG: molybdopterin-dependent oxidoreductase [Sandaracinus sp.]|nr:molybdopterin-dependent oxidoreductase [Sandaracinus sp.]
MIETHTTFCRICEALCGLEAEVEGGRVVQLRPDARHVATRGYACVKGLKQAEYLRSPDRLRYPLVRRGDELVRATWDDTLADIGRIVARERAIHPDRVAMYVGTAAGFGVLHPVFAQGFMTGVGSKSMFSSATQDCANKFAAATHLYGFPFTQPFPDLEHTKALFVVGANPAISKWSFLQVSNPIARLRELEARGCKIVFVDPRRTESAKAAGEHVFVRPGTDVWFYLAFLHELAARDARGERVFDREHVRKHARGFEDVLHLVKPWSPERCAEVTGIAPETIRRLVDVHVQATRDGGAAFYSSTGVNMGPHGSLGFWLQEAINLVTGNTDRRGGTLVGQGVIDFPAFGKKTGALLRRDRSRVGAFRSVNDTFPGGILADEILTPGERQIRVLFVTGGNPLLTMAGAARLRKAFPIARRPRGARRLSERDRARRDPRLAVHLALAAAGPSVRFSADARPAVAALPASDPRRRRTRGRATRRSDDLPRPRACFGRAALRVEGRARRAGDVARDAHRVDSATGSRGPAEPAGRAFARSPAARDAPRVVLRVALAATRARSVPSTRRAPFLGARVVTDDRKVDLAPEALLTMATTRLEPDFEAERGSLQSGKLRLITRRAVTTHNSWMHNHEAFVREGTNHLYMHGDDMRARGIASGDLVDVSSATATVRVPARELEDLAPGVVALPHGWGHQHAKGLRVASRTRGVNVNLLAADGPGALEPVSGMARLTAIEVDVVRAAEGRRRRPGAACRSERG